MKENIPLQKGEIIVLIQGYEGLYSITSFGRVWSHSKWKRCGRGHGLWGNKFLKCVQDKIGYLKVSLYRDGQVKTYRIHKLVATHYIENVQNLPQINHKDGNKQNNHVNNLEWCTCQENINHALIMGMRKKETSKYYGVTYIETRLNRKNKWLAYIRINDESKYFEYFITEIEAAKAYNDFVIKCNLDRPLNEIDEGEYLRAVEKSKKLKRKLSSKFRGVCFVNNKINPWRSQIKNNNKNIFLGHYSIEIEAAKAYNKYILENGLNRVLNDLGGYL